MTKRAAGKLVVTAARLSVGKVRCGAYVTLHWGPTRVLAERLVVAVTIMLIMIVAGLELDRIRLVDVFAYALAEMVTKVRVHL